MRFIAISILLAGSAFASADDPKLSVSLALVDLKAEFQKAKAERQSDFAPSTDKAVMRKQLDELFALSTPYGQKALRLAEENIRDPASLDALTWIVSGPFGYTEKCGPVIDAAYELLAERFSGDDRIAPVIEGIRRFGLSSTKPPEFLIAVIDRNPSRTIQGVACLKLGDLSIEYAQNARRLQQTAADGVSPNRERIGPQLVRSLTDTEPAQFEARAISVFERAIGEFGIVKAFPNQTVREIAEGRIFGLKELAVGKTAIALEGLDLRNNFVTLAAQRGKVVVLVFWAGWWAPSTAVAGSVNQLVGRFDGKPFVVIGVNGDASAAAAEQAATREKMTWPSIFDGNNGRGPIATKWGIPILPMIFVIDADGIIRHIAQDTTKLEKVIDDLLSKMK